MEVQNLPAYVTDLQNVYGDNTQTIGNGSAVYFKVFTSEDLEKMTDSLESATMGYLRQYAGRMWSREQDDGSICPGEEIWGVSLLYQRPTDSKEDSLGDMDIVNVLKHLADKPGLLGTVAGALDFFQEDPHHEGVLHSAFDDPSVELLQCYQVSDSGAFDGLLIAACRSNGEATFWIFLQG
ncbi:hypothetical protein [Phormidium sp. FACHB-1136]|uniref:hypothetical protein n=1 Tax=Phormidium sp. FACHB-1136 TaxID=2692848 RepID=UPI0016872E13|nr:hypothetical protein [Phormidium sp. FACHB-1136]MBD2427255.1 hypothetical protein [Phormidium sp. FACHB-1136]